MKMQNTKRTLTEVCEMLEVLEYSFVGLGVTSPDLPIAGLKQILGEVKRKVHSLELAKEMVEPWPKDRVKDSLNGVKHGLVGRIKFAPDKQPAQQGAQAHSSGTFSAERHEEQTNWPASQNGRTRQVSLESK